MNTEKIIMYDSPEAAQQKTITGWVGGGRYWGEDEHMARWSGCTHIKCECGNVVGKSWIRCEECRNKTAVSNYNALPFKEWNGKDAVCTWDGDRFFFNIDDLDEYMDENEMREIDLLLCEEMSYSPIDSETVAGDSHEDWEPTKELEEKIREFNEYLSTLPAHSYYAGKVRTSYKLS